MKYGLNKETIAKLKSVFTDYGKIEKVILYGSRALDNYRNGSDIDFVLLGQGLSLSDQLSIETRLDELMLPHKIDLSILKQIENEELKAHIARVGKVFYQKN